MARRFADPWRTLHHHRSGLRLALAGVADGLQCSEG
jgi:hypothetical protein